MKHPLLAIIALVVMIVLIVGIDVFFLSTLFWYRLVTNVVIFLVFLAIYLKFLQ